MTVCAPRAAASVTATVMPRSLNEPVGLTPSTLRYTVHPVSSDSTGACSSGVPPSPRVTTGTSAGTGRLAAYSAMIPRHGRGLVIAGVTAAPGMRLEPDSPAVPGSLALQGLDAHHTVHVPYGFHGAQH